MSCPVGFGYDPDERVVRDHQLRRLTEGRQRTAGGRAAVSPGRRWALAHARRRGASGHRRRRCRSGRRRLHRAIPGAQASVPTGWRSRSPSTASWAGADMPSSAGYSGTPLPKKLGITSGTRFAVEARSRRLRRHLWARCRSDAEWRRQVRPGVDVVVAFYTRRATMLRGLAEAHRRGRTERHRLDRVAQAFERGGDRHHRRRTARRVPADRLGRQQGVCDRRDLERPAVRTPARAALTSASAQRRHLIRRRRRHRIASGRDAVDRPAAAVARPDGDGPGLTRSSGRSGDHGDEDDRHGDHMKNG